MNGDEVDGVVDLAIPFLRERSMIGGDSTDSTRQWLLGIVPALASSIDRLSQIPDRMQTIFSYDARTTLAQQEIRREFEDPGSRRVVEALAEDLRDAPRLVERETFRAAAGRVKDKTGLKGKALFHPIRVALTGAAEGPELDLLVPAIDRATRLPPGAGIAIVIGCRERAASFAECLQTQA